MDRENKPIVTSEKSENTTQPIEDPNKNMAAISDIVSISEIQTKKKKKNKKKTIEVKKKEEEEKPNVSKQVRAMQEELAKREAVAKRKEEERRLKREAEWLKREAERLKMEEEWRREEEEERLRKQEANRKAEKKAEEDMWLKYSKRARDLLLPYPELIKKPEKKEPKKKKKVICTYIPGRNFYIYEDTEGRPPVKKKPVYHHKKKIMKKTHHELGDDDEDDDDDDPELESPNPSGTEKVTTCDADHLELESPNPMPDDDLEEATMEDMMKSVLMKINNKKSVGICVQASTLGSLEAMLKSLEALGVNVCGINIGPIQKKDVRKASLMLEKKILAFHVEVTLEAQKLADELGVKIFVGDIIQDVIMAYMRNLKEEKKQELAAAAYDEKAVFPLLLKINPNCVFDENDPIVVWVKVVQGIVKVGTPLCIPQRDCMAIGRIESIEHNHRRVDMAEKGNEVCIKIVWTNPNHFSRRSINSLPYFFLSHFFLH